MLIVTRRPGERVMVGDQVVITVIEVKGSSVRIGIDAPRAVPVYREEIYAAMQQNRGDEPSAAPK
jgi:carbon storage regulator